MINHSGRRGQSNTVGTVLLLGIVTLTITGAGGVVITDLQSNVDSTPLADLDSDVSPIEMQLEHRGGEPLDPDKTSIELIGVDEEAELERRIGPGDSESWEFDRLDGPVDILVIDDESGGVIYRNSHSITNPIEDLILAVDGWTEPVYLLEGHPANYTVNLEFEEGVPADVTDRANVTVEDDSIVEVNAEENMLTGLDTDTTDSTANTSGFTTNTEVEVLQSDPPLNVDNTSTEIQGLVSVDAKGELVELGGLPSVDIYFKYWPSRAFTDAPASTNDSVIADGEFHLDPDGYAHDGDYVHDNEPLVEGKTRVFEYDEAGSSAQYRPHLRDDQKDEPDGSRGSSFHSGDRVIIPNDEQFRAEVTLSDDGETADIVVYDEIEDGDVIAEQNDIDVSDRSELYYSTYEWSGSTGETSLRLIGIEDFDEYERVQAATDAEDKQLYSSNVTGFEIEQGYSLVTHAEQQIGGKVVEAQTDPVSFSTTGPTVETVGVEAVDIATIDAKGELVDLADANDTDLYFKYWPSRIFTEAPTSTNDSVIADGKFHTSPDGYAHDGDYVHDNEPLVEGKTRVFEYDEAGSTAQYRPHLRDDQKDEPDGSRGSTFYSGDRVTIPNDEQFRAEVTLSEGGESVDIVVYDEIKDGDVISEQDDIDVSERSEVYYSTYEWSGSTGETSLRLISIEDVDEFERSQVATDVEDEQPYTTTINPIQPERGYTLAAFAESEDDGVAVDSIGDTIEIKTAIPVVDMVDVDIPNSSTVEAEGELVDLGDANETDIYFEYWPSRAFTEEPADNEDGIIADGKFHTGPDGYAHDGDYVHDNEPLTAGKTRVFEYDEAGSTAQYRPHLRDDKKDEPDGSRGSSFYSGDRVTIPNDEQFRAEVTLSEGGETVDIVVYDEIEDGDVISEQDDIDVSERSEVYYSTYEWSGSTGETSLRLIGIEDVDESERPQVATNVEDEQNYTANLDAEVGINYVTATVAETADGDRIVNSSGQSVVEFMIEELTVSTRDSTATGLSSVELEGELVDLGDIYKTDLSFEYWPSRLFTEEPADNEDGVIADGEFHTGPGGYAHDGDYVHDNEPLVEGKTRVFEYDEAESSAQYRPHLRDDKKDEPDGSRGLSFYTGDREQIPNDEQFRVEVTLSENSETVDIVVYDEIEDGNVIGHQKDIDVSERSEIYYSTYEWSGSTGETSLRLIGIEDVDEYERVQAATDVTDEQVYTDEITGIQPDTGYTFTATAESDSAGINWTATEQIDFSTESQDVETRSVQIEDQTIDATGELVDLGDANKSDLYFEYWPSRAFAEEPADNEDRVIADGEFHHGPDGYAHDGDYVHDNEPLTAGKTRVFKYDEAGSSAQYRPHLRDDKKDEPDGSRGSTFYSGDRVTIPNDEQFRVEVTLSEGGESVDIVVYDEIEDGDVIAEQNDIDVSDRLEVYYSTYEWSGSTGETSFRLIGIEDIDESERPQVATDVEDEQEYSKEIQLDSDQGYMLRAYAETELKEEDMLITATGEIIEFETE